jgi:hypothetical protein
MTTTTNLTVIAQQLRTATSRHAARAALRDLTVAQLRELARETDVPVPGRATKPQLQETLISILVGFRLDADAIMRHSSAHA